MKHKNTDNNYKDLEFNICILMTDYYSDLGVNKNSEQNEIKKAYRQLAMKWHPDKNNSPEASDMFKKINEAYDILGNPEKRKIYDQFGKEGLNKHGMQFNPMNMRDIFSEVFGMNLNGMFSMNNFKQEANQNIVITENLTLEEVFSGKKIKREFDRLSLCSVCLGTGSDDGKNHECSKCHGNGMIQQRQQLGPFTTITNSPCPDCCGNKCDKSHACKKCNGNKFIPEKSSIEFDVPAGMTEENFIIHPESGHIDLKTKKRGNLEIKFNIIQHQQFLRRITIERKEGRVRLDANDLFVRMKLSIAEALCGCTKILKHVDGHEVKFSLNEMIKNEDIYAIENEGVCGKGKLYIIFEIEYQTLSEEKKKKLWKLLMNSPYVKPVGNHAGIKKLF